MAKAKKNQHRSGVEQQRVDESLDEEFALLWSLFDPYAAREDLLDALTRASAPGELLTLLFVSRKNPLAVHLGLTWAVSDEIQVLSSTSALFLCDVDDTDFILPVLSYLHNVPNFGEAFTRHSTNGIPETPSLIVLAPATRTLVYAEYSCTVTSLATVLMVLHDSHAEQPSGVRGARVRPLDEMLDEETDSVEESEYYSDTSDDAVHSRQRDGLASLHRVQERHDIHNEYLEALEADRRAETAAHDQSLREKAEHEQQAREKIRRAELATHKANIRSTISTVAQTADSVRICLRTRTGEKVVFNVPPTESVQVPLDMAFATDQDATQPSHVSIRSISPSVVYHGAMDPLPTVGEVVSGCSTFTFVTEYAAQ